MADAHNHYERAFAAHLRSLRTPCIPVDESRRARDGEWTLKSLDFVLGAPRGQLRLIDVKGRRVGPNRFTLENWVTVDDIAGLIRWEEIFGRDSRALLMFVYHLQRERPEASIGKRFTHAERHYGCLGITVADYSRHMRVRSPKWRTVSMPQATFRRFAKPIGHWLEASA